MSKIAREVAEHEINGWLDGNDISTDVESMNEADAEAFKSSTEFLVKPMMAGALTVNGDKLTYKPFNGSELLGDLTFRQANAGDMSSMRVTPGAEPEALLRLAGRLCSKDYKIMCSIKGRDYAVVTSVVGLLSGALQSSW